MKTSFQLIVSLTAICLISGTLLAIVHGATAERIAAVAQMRTAAAAAQVLPPHATVESATEVTHNDTTYLFRPARREDGSLAGFAIQMATSAGYGGEIRLMLGIDPDGTTTGLAILPGHKETPGLGAKITETAFLRYFQDKPLIGTNWQVRKDGGAIDEITAATISSRAVADAVAAAAAAFDADREMILGLE